MGFAGRSNDMRSVAIGAAASWTNLLPPPTQPPPALTSAQGVRNIDGMPLSGVSFADLVTQYGYLAVFVGSLLEGETILVLAGFAVHQGHLRLPTVLAIAFAGGALGDQAFFWIGRVWGPALLRRWPGLQRSVQRVGELLQRHDAPLIVGIRFMYGLRIAGPIAMGVCGVAPWRFALFNLLGAAIWASAVGGLGYLLGEALQAVLGDVRRFEDTALLVVVGAAIAFAVGRRCIRWWSKVRRRRAHR